MADVTRSGWQKFLRGVGLTQPLMRSLFKIPAVN
jgi:hypothetical protein